jgi:hypothetical protein
LAARLNSNSIKYILHRSILAKNDNQRFYRLKYHWDRALYFRECSIDLNIDIFAFKYCHRQDKFDIVIASKYTPTLTTQQVQRIP